MAKKQPKGGSRKGAKRKKADDPYGGAKPAKDRAKGVDHIEVIGRGLIRQGSWILLCRNTKHGYYYLPGGHVEPGEGAGEAVCREMMEEAGLKVKAGECLAVAEVRFTQGGRDRHELNLVFHVEQGGPAAGKKTRKGGVFHVEQALEVAPRPISSLEEGIEFEWVDAAAIVDVDLRPLVLKAWLAAGGSVGGGGGSVAWMAVFEA